MSKRRGDFVTLDELIERIGVDATRWFMLSRSHDSTIDLDLELARQAGPREPRLLRADVHARIAAIFRQPRRAGGGGAGRASPARVALNDAERELVRKVLAFPAEVREAVERRAPHRIATYALELGQAFAAFYRDSPVRDEPDEALQDFRIALCVATRRTLAARARPARRVGSGVHVDARLDDLYGPGPPPAALHPRRQPRAGPLQRAAVRVHRGVAAARVRRDVRDHRRRGPRDARARAGTSSAASRRRRRRPLRRHAG